MSLKLGLRNKIRRSRAGGFTGLLDQSFATGATAAYSLRRLKSTATKAVRVREDSGNTEADIGFSGGTLDTTALLNHVGSNNGFVTKWYDQSGNGNNASESTASNQPQIVNSGSVIQENGRPALQFDGSNDYLEAITNAYSQPFTSLLICSVGNLNDKSEYFIATKNLGTVIYKNSGNYNVWNGDQIFGKTTDKKQVLYWFLSNSPNSEFYLSGTLQGTGDTGSGNFNNIAIGREYGGKSDYNSEKIQEFVFYPKNKSLERNKFESNINNHYSIF